MHISLCEFSSTSAVREIDVLRINLPYTNIKLRQFLLTWTANQRCSLKCSMAVLRLNRGK